MRNGLGIITLLVAWCLCLTGIAWGAPENGEQPFLARAPGPAAPPQPVVTTNIWVLLIKVVLTLGIICAFIYGMFWFIARKGRLRSGPGHAIRLVESLPVGPNRFIGIFQVAQRHFLFGVTEQQISKLGELDADDVLHLYRQGEEVERPDFRQYLGGTLRRIKKKDK